MKVVIIEDEQLTAANLAELLRDIIPGVEIGAVLQSVSESVDWFKNNPMPDVVFMDIHLADGSSFSIFDRTDITCPIIFTTAYDEYALRAFRVNSVDYLLKPVSKESLERALDKLRRLSGTTPVDNSELIRQIASAVKQKDAVYKSSLLVPVRDKLTPVSVKDIAYIYVEERNSVIVRFDGAKYEFASSLDDIMKLLDPSAFYRANRQFIVARLAVKDISLWFGSRIAVNLKVPVDERIIISRAHAQEFKKWITE